MANADDGPSGLSVGADQIIRSRYDTLQSLPAPGKGWLSREVPPELRRLLKLLVGIGAVEKIHREVEGNVARWVYQTARPFWGRLQEYDGSSTRLPCGHHGLRNLRRGGYSCKYEPCEEEFDRETVEEVIGHGS